MELNKWPIFDSKTLSNSKIVLLHDLKPVVDMFNVGGVGIGIRTANEVISELSLNSHDRSRLMALMGCRSFDVYSVRAALNDHVTDTELEHLLVDVLKVYPKTPSARKNLRKHFYESKKIKTL